MPFQRSWYYFQQLLGALATTHALGIVHRDIKPSNILIRRDGIVKLTDFGIARPPLTSVDPALLLGHGTLAPGTGAYMSPEQVLSLPLDGRSDLYSAAIVLYECLTGRLPFDIEGKGEYDVRRAQVEDSPISVRAWLPQAPPILDTLFARALSKDPTQRFSDAIEMGEAFRAGLGLPDSAEWRAQAAMADEAKVPPNARTMPIHSQTRSTLRELMMKKYATSEFAKGA